MADNNERNLNVTIKSDVEEKEEVIISISSILRYLKKYLIIWIITAVIIFVAVFGFSTLSTIHRKPALTALVSFTYSGIEKGLDPAGRKFDIQSIKSPVVIEMALTEMNMTVEELDGIREGLSFYAIIPEDAYKRIAAYQEVAENASSGNLAAVQAMLDVSYYPTMYRVNFDYSKTNFSRNEAVYALNTLLECYQDYFYDTYGYNESLGNSVTAIDIESYDYSEAVDVISNSLTSLRRYVKQISNEDSTRFRSTVTGYTFDDLYEAIGTVKNIDLDKISSYINVNNLTKDKDASIAYYEYRINALTRQQTSLQEQLQSITESITDYEKDSIYIFGNGTESTNTEATQASAQYDKMLQQKLNVAEELADTKQSINYYKERKSALERSSSASEKKSAQVEADITKVYEKTKELVDYVTLTADDYYENVTFKNAYNILIPAVNSPINTISDIVSNAKMPLIILEGLIFLIYMIIAFVGAVIFDSRKNKAAKTIPASAVSVSSIDNDSDNNSVKEEKETSADNSEKADEKNSESKTETKDE